MSQGKGQGGHDKIITLQSKSGVSESDDVSSSGGDSSFDSSDSDFLDFPIETLLKGARRKSASDTRQLKRYQNKNQL